MQDYASNSSESDYDSHHSVGNSRSTTRSEVNRNDHINVDDSGESGEEWENIPLDVRMQMAKRASVRTSLNKNVDRSDMDDLTARMSRLTTENGSPNSKDCTIPTGGVSHTNQSQPRDSVDLNKTVDREESTRQTEPIPKLRLTKVDGKWMQKPYKLSKVNDKWMRVGYTDEKQPDAQTKSVDMLHHYMTGLTDDDFCDFLRLNVDLKADPDFFVSQRVTKGQIS